MNSKEFQSAVLIKLDSAMGEMREVKRIAKAVEMKVENIAPQGHLHPIPRPPQKEVGRDLNIASWFRLKTTEENAKLPKNAARTYIEFPEHLTDEQLNEDMKRCMYNIMCERLKPGWETMNWNMIYNSDKMLGEQIIKEAALRPEMAVIAQSSGYWAIRKIAEQRQKSTKRSAEQRNARVRVRKENRGSFGSHRRGKEEMFHEHATEAEKLDEEYQVSTAGDRELEKMENEDNQKTSLAPPIVSMAEEAVTIVEDLETQADSDDGDHVLEKPMTDEISSDSSAENMNPRKHTNNDTVRKETQAPAENIALLKALKTLTPEQINALISQSEISAAKQPARSQKTNGITKRKTKKHSDGQASVPKKQIRGRKTKKINQSGARTSRTVDRPSLSKK